MCRGSVDEEGHVGRRERLMAVKSGRDANPRQPREENAWTHSETVENRRTGPGGSRRS